MKIPKLPELIRDEIMLWIFKVLQDKQRIFNETKQDTFDEQEGNMQSVEEMPEFNEDVHGDHILLYKDGHPTTQDNCAAVH